MLVGYARVSTIEQDTALQLDALNRAGVHRVFWEKGSSVGSRPELRRALASLVSGDVLVVYKLDRIARSLKDLLLILEMLELRGVGLRSLTEPIDTGTPAGRLMIQILGAVAEFERSLIRQRSMAGQQAARDRGQHCGRPRSSTPKVESQVLRLWSTGKHTHASLADRFDLHPSTIKRIVYRKHRPDSSSLK